MMDMEDEKEKIWSFDYINFDDLWRSREKVTALESIIVSELLKRHSAERTLEIGCGNGRLSPIIQASSREYFATDLTMKFLEHARKNCKGNGTFFRSNLYHLPFKDESFSSVVMIRVFNFITAPLMALREICRILSPGGAFIFTYGPTPSLGTFIDDLKVRFHGHSGKNVSITFSLKDRVSLPPPLAFTIMYRRNYVRDILISSGFRIEIKRTTGLEDYAILKKLPLSLYHSISEILRFIPVFPTEFILATKKGQFKGISDKMEDIWICPKCHGGISMPQKEDKGLCKGCGELFPITREIPDLFYTDPGAEFEP